MPSSIAGYKKFCTVINRRQNILTNGTPFGLACLISPVRDDCKIKATFAFGPPCHLVQL
jgi:hypothetical protein